MSQEKRVSTSAFVKTVETIPLFKGGALPKDPPTVLFPTQKDARLAKEHVMDCPIQQAYVAIDNVGSQGLYDIEDRVRGTVRWVIREHLGYGQNDIQLSCLSLDMAKLALLAAAIQCFRMDPPGKEVILSAWDILARFGYPTAAIDRGKLFIYGAP